MKLRRVKCTNCQYSNVSILTFTCIYVLHPMSYQTATLTTECDKMAASSQTSSTPSRSRWRALVNIRHITGVLAVLVKTREKKRRLFLGLLFGTVFFHMMGKGELSSTTVVITITIWKLNVVIPIPITMATPTKTGVVAMALALAMKMTMTITAFTPTNVFTSEYPTRWRVLIIPA